MDFFLTTYTYRFQLSENRIHIIQIKNNFPFALDIFCALDRATIITFKDKRNVIALFTTIVFQKSKYIT